MGSRKVTTSPTNTATLCAWARMSYGKTHCYLSTINRCRQLTVQYICIRYHVYDIGDPYVTYNINVTVQQFDFKTTSYADEQDDEEGKEVWSTVGYAEIGPQRMGDNTQRQNKAKTSGPQVGTLDHTNCIA